MKRIITITLIFVAAVALVGSVDAKTKRKSSGKSSQVTSVVKEFDPEKGFESDLYPIFIEIYKTGYSPSTRFKSTFAKAAGKFKGKAQFYRINIDKYPELIDELNIYDLPYVWILTGPNATASLMGEMPLDYLMMQIDGLVNDYRRFNYDYEYDY